MMEIIQELLPSILELVLAFAVPWLLAQIGRFVTARAAAATDERVAGALQVLEQIVSVHLVQINKDVVEKLKAANADGVLTPEEIAAIKAYAKSSIWAVIPTSIKDILLKVIPGGEDGIIGGILDPLIEFALKRLKADGLVPTTAELREKAEVITAAEHARARQRLKLI